MNRIDRTLNFRDIDGRSIRFPNFSGRAIPPFNPEGKRTFCIDILDPEFAKELADEGWNVRYDTKEREDGMKYPPNLKIVIKYGNSQPRIMMEQAGNKVWLDEETIGDLDNMEIIRIVEMEVRPYNWQQPSGASGVTAYLNKMRIEVARDMFCD